MVTGAADRIPERISELVYLDTAPLPDGAILLEKFPPEARERTEDQVQELGEGWKFPMPPPEELANMASLEGVDEDHLRLLYSRATLVDAGTNAITGIIDWTDAAIADPARDLALVYRDLGPEVFEVVLAHYSGPFDDADRERAVFYARCALLEDIAYGLSTPDARRYVEAGLAHLARTFGDSRSTRWP